MRLEVVMRRKSKYCNALQHTATHCNTLQHTATHCNRELDTLITISVLWKLRVSSFREWSVFHVLCFHIVALLLFLTYVYCMFSLWIITYISSHIYNVFSLYIITCISSQMYSLSSLCTTRYYLSPHTCVSCANVYNVFSLRWMCSLCVLCVLTHMCIMCKYV